MAQLQQEGWRVAHPRAAHSLAVGALSKEVGDVSWISFRQRRELWEIQVQPG